MRLLTLILWEHVESIALCIARFASARVDKCYAEQAPTIRFKYAVR
jgi:hypothetical protein